ncbi:MAG: hypothetical protein AB7T07_13295 [Steroidobacteraceae bacterium]
MTSANQNASCESRKVREGAAMSLPVLLTLLLLAAGFFSGYAHAAGSAKSSETTSAQRHPDFSGVWETASIELTVLPDFNHPKYTERTKQNINEYQTRFNPVKDDPARVCLLKGMPWTMLIRARNYPAEIFQTDQRIFMFFELYDQYRNIHLDQTAVPDAYPPSANGYSYARWEGDTLVVETGGLIAMNDIGEFHRSEQAHIIERWKLMQNPTYGEVLDVDITVDDPEIYVEPVKGHQVLKRSAPGVVVGGYNCSSTLWDTYVDRRRQEMGDAKQGVKQK